MRTSLFVAAAILGLGFAACDGRFSGGAGGGPGGAGAGAGGGAGAGVGGGQGAGLECPPENRNDEIRKGLAQACAGCHLSGNKPWWASLAAFENGLVYDERYIKRGDPDGSVFMQVLKGTAQGSYPQMPPGEPYAALLADGRSKMTLEDLEQWIRDLPPPGTRGNGPDPAHFTVRRLAADEMVVSLMDQLGLTVADFVSTSAADWQQREYVARGDRLFVWPTDWAPGVSNAYVSDKRATERYETLGGQVTLVSRKKDQSLGPAAMQTLTQVSQAWCRIAIEKTGNTAVLRHVTLADTSATKADAIKQNIAALYLRMLGEVPSTTEVDEVYQGVYLPLEPKNTKTAWVGVCASFVRHPLWVSY